MVQSFDPVHVGCTARIGRVTIEHGVHEVQKPASPIAPTLQEETCTNDDDIIVVFGSSYTVAPILIK